MDGIEVALDALTIPACVASGSSHERIRVKLELAQLYERFRGRIFSSDEVPEGKPVPDLFLHAVRQMGVEPSACAVVEDSVAGVEAGRAAGMRVFAYAGGLFPAGRLTGADTVVFHEMRKLPELLGKP